MKAFTDLLTCEFFLPGPLVRERWHNADCPASQRSDTENDPLLEAGDKNHLDND